MPVKSASMGQAYKLTVWIGIIYVQLWKLDTKTENYKQNNEER